MMLSINWRHCWRFVTISLPTVHYYTQKHNPSLTCTVRPHDQLRDVLVVMCRPSRPPLSAPPTVDVYVDRRCGRAVMRGAHVFAVGVIGSSAREGIVIMWDHVYC